MVNLAAAKVDWNTCRDKPVGVSLDEYLHCATSAHKYRVSLSRIPVLRAVRTTCDFSVQISSLTSSSLHTGAGRAPCETSTNESGRCSGDASAYSNTLDCQAFGGAERQGRIVYESTEIHAASLKCIYSQTCSNHQRASLLQCKGSSFRRMCYTDTGWHVPVLTVWEAFGESVACCVR